MFSQACVIVSTGDGYLWFQVPFQGGWVCPGGLYVYMYMASAPLPHVQGPGPSLPTSNREDLQTDPSSCFSDLSEFLNLLNFPFI